MDFDVADPTCDPSLPNRRPGAVRPVTIRQLIQTKIKEELTRNGIKPRRTYILGDDEFCTATFVGHIIDVTVSGETTRTIRIDDGTGKITSTHTIDKDQEEEDPPRWRAGKYARVFGVPREFKEAVVFDIFFLRPVKDFHEVIFHLMEAMAVTFQHSRGQPLPKLHDSKFARATGPSLPLSTAEPDLSISMRSLALNSPSLRSQPLPVASTSRVNGDPREDSDGSDAVVPTRNAGTTSIQDISDDGGGSTEYYTDQPPDSPRERSPSPTPVHPFARNHSYEGHLDREEGPSSQSSQSTQKPKVRPNDEESEDGRTPRRKSKLRRRDGAVPRCPKNSSDEELEVLRSEFSSQIAPSTPSRNLKPDPYAGWSPAKRNVMVFVQSKPAGEEVNVRRAMVEGTSKLEMRNAIRELVKEGEIETVDGINYRLTDKGPKYPRF